LIEQMTPTEQKRRRRGIAVTAATVLATASLSIWFHWERLSPFSWLSIVLCLVPAWLVWLLLYAMLLDPLTPATREYRKALMQKIHEDNLRERAKREAQGL
jgi:hypothetical protein